MKLATTPSEKKAWMAQWKGAAKALEEVKREELQSLTEDEAARIVLEVLPEPDYAALAAEPQAECGLVEQQRLFMRALRR